MSSFIYVIPCSCGQADYDLAMRKALVGIERTPVRHHLLTTIWGSRDIGTIKHRMMDGEVEAIISISYGRANNPSINRFEILYRDGCDRSRAAGTSVQNLTLPNTRLEVTMDKSMKYSKNAPPKPNPLFEEFGCRGLLIRPCYRTAVPNVCMEEEAGKFQTSVRAAVECAIMAFDSAPRRPE